MKAITIWQPYAAAIRTGLKHYETRSWHTKYRGLLVIHAALKKPTAREKELIKKQNTRKRIGIWRANLAL